VLVLVLVLLGLIAGLVLEAVVTARSTLELETVHLQSVRLQAAAVDAVRHALQQLADDEMLSVDHEKEEWAKPIERKHPSGISTWVRITDENRRFDLNNLHVEAEDLKMKPAAEVVMDILTLCGDFTPIEKVQSLIDWIDPDDDGFRETAYYEQQDPPYDPANTWLKTWSELPHVAGLTRSYFVPRERFESGETFRADVVDCVAVLPGRRSKPVPVNVNTAPREVLLGVLGLEQEELAQYIVLLRKEHPLVSLEPIAMVADPLVIDLAGPYLDVKSNTFRVEARAFEEGRSAQLWALVRRDGKGSVRVLRWVY
jgi:type II secretory pathway component PulK